MPKLPGAPNLNHMRLSLLLAAFSFFSVPLHSQGFPVWKTSEIQWQRIDANGGRYAVLEGDPHKDGIFTYAYLLPDGALVQPHTHTGTARVVVVSGTLLLGRGTVAGKSFQVLPSGSTFVVPANSPHWEGARGDTLIVGVGTGPWKTEILSSPPNP